MHSKYIYNSTILVLIIFSCTAHGIHQLRKKIHVPKGKLISLPVEPTGPTLDIMIPDFNIIVKRL